jgi:hypothetical protein
MSAKVIHLQSRFDPRSESAEEQYDRVVHRMNKLAAGRHRNRGLINELQRQFVENDLTALSGRRRGRPLTSAGRRRRLSELLALNHELRSMDEEREGLGRELATMNRALDAWARDTYGLGDSNAGNDS